MIHGGEVPANHFTMVDGYIISRPPYFKKGSNEAADTALAEESARRIRAAEEEKAYCEAQNKKAEEMISAAIQSIREGGILKNTTIVFYQSRYHSSSYSIVNYLMRLYHVSVPLRTQGWINDKLHSATIEDGKCEHLKYYRAQNGRVSQKFFDCMRELIQAVAEQTPVGEPTNAT